MLRPDYFVENQRPGHNRHDKLLPSMSALILINHVKDGVELAREHNLPRVIADAILQHHGTRLIKLLLQQGPGAEGPGRDRRHRGEVPLSRAPSRRTR